MCDVTCERSVRIIIIIIINNINNASNNYFTQEKYEKNLFVDSFNLETRDKLKAAVLFILIEHQL